MNKVYKVIWSKVKGCYVVVSELTKKNGKSKYEHICREGVCELSLKAILCVLAITGSALFWPMEVSAGTQYGDDSWADGYNTAIGISARARGDGALALGTQTKATSIRSTAIGHQAEASGTDSISIGTLSGASRDNSIAIGQKARATGVDAMAFGSAANALATNAMAMGLNARTTASGSVAVGVNTEVTQINSVAMGATAKTYGDSAVSLGVDVVSRGHSAVAVGANARALTQSAVSLGDSTYANALSAVSVGVSSRATAVRALAVGDSAGATAEDTVAIGGAAKANATGAVAIGKDALANQEAGTAVGIAAEATGQYAAAFGDAAKASVRWGTAIGTGSLANVAAGAVGYDPSGNSHYGDTTGTWKSTLGAVAVGDTTRNKTRQIIGVAAGTNDTDAVNVAQLKAAQLGGGGDSSWVIQDTNSPQGRKTIDKNNPLTVRGDRYIKAEVGYDGLNLKLDENQLNNSISNNSTVQNNRTDINNLKSGFNLKAGSATSQVRLGEGTTPTIEFATADDTMTVNLSDKKVTYGIDKNKLVKNITGDLITNINNSTTTPITNIKAQFGVTADSGSQKTVTLTKDTTPTVKFKGDGKYLTSVTDTDGVQYSVDENKLNQNITNITNEAIKGKGLYFGANSGATVLNKLGSTVKIQGEGTKADSEYSGKNVKTKVSQDASGNTIIDVMLDKELSADKVIVGKAGADGKDGVIGVNGKDGVSGVGINGKDGISVKGDKGEVGINGNDGISIKGKDGKDAVTINGKDGVPGVDGKEGHIGLNGKDGITDIWTRPGQPGLNGANGTTMTRVVYKDPKGNEHEVATLDDGLKFAGDDGQTDKSKVIAKLLNKTMDIVGGADNTKLTDGNIGVNNVNGKLQVQLASALNGITSISNGKAGSSNTTITLGDGTVNVGGSTISNVKSALNGTALANASEDQKKSAATIGDLKDAVNNATLGKGLYFGANSGATVLNKLESTVKIQGEGTKADSEYSGQNVKTKISQDANGNTVIDLMLAKKAVFDSVTTGNTIIDNRGLTVGGTTYVSDSGLNAGGKKITNVADGTDPHDAVNVSQLNKVVAGATTKVADGKNTTVTSETNANGSKTYHVNLNDDITLGTDPSKQISIKGTEGTIKAGKVTVDGSKGTVNGLTNLTWDPNHFTSGQAATEDQLKAVAGQITKAAKQSSVSAGKNITVTKGTNADGGVDYKVATADDLNLNSVTTGTTVINDKGLTVGGTTYVSKDGLNAGGKKIINVAPGELSKNSTDAVNGSQLYQTNEVINKIGGTINNMDNRINRVGAGAAALAALHPLDFDPDSKWDFAAGYGNYKGANAVAVGAYYRPNEDTMISVGGSMGGGQNMINAGVSLKIGRGNHVSTSRVAMAKEIKDLRAELENMKGALMKVSEGRPLDSLDMDKMQLFPDVPANHWAYDYVATLAGNGVIVGYPDGQFGGDRMMTRYEMAALIYRAMQNGAAADDRMARALKEFEPELERIRVDTITKHKDGTPDIQRVRVIKGRG
mgnify:CR=1 FL=1